MYSGEDMIIIIVWRPQTTREKARKPVGICGVSSGAWGGTRICEQFAPGLPGLPPGSPPLKAVHFLKVQEIFDEEGRLLVR